MRITAVFVALVLAGAVSAAHAATPIPEGPADQSIPQFTGHRATPNPVPFTEPPRHPFMAPNQRSNLHVDAFQSDVNTWFGPLGNSPSRSSNFFAHDCASIAFDSQGRLVTICVGITEPILQLIDPQTLDVLASMKFPPRVPQTTGNPNIFQNFSGGGYFYLDENDEVVAPTTTRHIWVVKETSGPGFAVDRDYDLSNVVPLGDSIISALPDWSGRIWVVSTGGVVATIDPGSGSVKSTKLEAIGNSFAVGPDGGVYIVTDKAMYRLDAAADGTPTVTWREAYANDGTKKPGQSQAGSGTTPTLMGSGYVAITDNADPVDIVVYRRAKSVSGSRVVCKQPIFTKGQSSTDQSLVATATSMVAENNYGYTGPQATEQGATTTPGVERVDLDPGGGCHKVWHNDTIAPTSVPKLSAADGLVYVWSKPKLGGSTDAWYLTAIDFHTGKTVFNAFGGEGLGFNNNYAPVTLGPDGTAYIGTLGGIVRVADKTPPTAPAGAVSPTHAKGARPRVALRLRYRRTGRRCTAGPVTAAIRGADARSVRRVLFTFAGARRVDTKKPFRVSLVPRRHGLRKLRAKVRLADGRPRTLTRRVRVCSRSLRTPRFVG